MRGKKKKDQEWLEKFELLTEAMKRFKDVLSEKKKNELVRDATIKRFEFTYELFWKTMKKMLFDIHGIDVFSPKDVFKKAYGVDWITNEDKWLEMLNDRNNTVHAYYEKIAIEIAKRAKKHYEEMKKVYELLNKKYVLKGKGSK